MSWRIFRSNMLRYMANPNGVSTSAAYAKKITTEYDLCMRRGIQGINLCTIQKGNPQAMEALISATLAQSFANPGPSLSPLIKNMGSAIKAYWAGAQMVPFPIPPIPAPGSISNLVVTQNICISPGTWVAQFPTPPVLSPTFLIDFFILGCQIHLLTLKGMIYTTSMYPAAPSPVPGPGVINWSGYIIPGGIGSFDSDDDDNNSDTSTGISSDWQPIGPASTVGASLNNDGSIGSGGSSGIGAGVGSGGSSAGGDFGSVSDGVSTINAKKYSEASIYNSGDLVEYNGKVYIAQNPDKNGERCWDAPF